MLCILDRQHGATGRRTFAPGAAYDLDGDGVTGENGEREVDLVDAYFGHARAALERLGHEVLVLDTGDYGARHEQAIAAAQDAARAVYVAGHVNAGGGRYALVRHDHRSDAGARLGRMVLRHLAAVPELGDGRLWPLAPQDRGWSCVDGIYAGPAWLCGILLEPYFIDSKAHRRLSTAAGLLELGTALAAACDEWARTEGRAVA